MPFPRPTSLPGPAGLQLSERLRWSDAETLLTAVRDLESRAVEARYLQYLYESDRREGDGA